MRAGLRSAIGLVLLGLCAGVALVQWPRFRAADEPDFVPRPPATRMVAARTHSQLVARELRIVRPDSSTAIRWGSSSEGGPGMWMTGPPTGGSVQIGVHANGFPFVLVSDGAVRNFGLGRVDGRNASPILVYRSNDVVRMVFGLGMTEAGQPPFLAHYTADGRQHEYIGGYCDAPSRVCTE